MKEKLGDPEVAYIYYATPGLNGAYVDSLLEAHACIGIRVRVYVNSSYAYGGVSGCRIFRCFFPFTESKCFRRFAGTSVFALFRKCLRYVELILGLVFAIISIKSSRCRVVNYSLTESFRVNRFAIRALKLLGYVVVVTMHDVIPHSGRQDNIRASVVHDANYLLVHNEYAKGLILEQFPHAADKILIHVFPWSAKPPPTVSARKLLNDEASVEKHFLFAGYVRWSKGVDRLIDCWMSSYVGNTTQRLLIAGQAVTSEVDDLINISQDAQNISWDLRRLDDQEYLDAMCAADVVCLPYRDTYAHSSVHLVAYLWAEKCVIASRVGPFLEDLTTEIAFLFDGEDLSSAMHTASCVSIEELKQRGQQGRECLLKRLEALPAELKSMYQTINQK